MEEFFCKTKIITGAGAVAALKQWNIQRLLLVCDPYFADNGTAQQIIHAAESPKSHVFSQVVPDPSVTLAAKGAALVREFKPDAVVALGGGSTMDTAKAMVYFSGLQPMFVAIPTTSGSGSEVTNFAILTHEGVKHPLVDEQLKPDIAILDSCLVTSLPPALVADGGFDLISHALEAYVATGRSGFTDTLAAGAFQTAIEYLPQSFRGNTAVRGDLHMAASMAGIAFSQAGLGVCHAISHSIGGEFHTPHGRLNAILLPAVIDRNAPQCTQLYAQIARLAGLSGGSNVMALRALKNVLIRLRRTLQLPETLADAGIQPEKLFEKLDHLTDSALADPCCATNPVPVQREMIRSIIMEVAGRV